MRLKDRVSLVTGAGQGIGRAIAIAFAREGSRVAVNDVEVAGAETVVREIQKLGGEAIAVGADVSRVSEVTAMIDRVIRSFRKIDVLVNNAGIQTETPFTDITEDEWERIISVNLKGTFLCGQLAARQMIRQGGGKIINMSSIHQILPRPTIAHYASSKGGIMMLSRVMALELAGHNVNVNCIAPGAIETAMNKAVLNSPERLEEMNSKIPWGRMGTPDEVAHAAVYLASDEAAYVTGSTLYVDGGLSLGRL